MKRLAFSCAWVILVAATTPVALLAMALCGSREGGIDWLRKKLPWWKIGNFLDKELTRTNIFVCVTCGNDPDVNVDGKLLCRKCFELDYQKVGPLEQWVYGYNNNRNDVLVRPR